MNCKCFRTYILVPDTEASKGWCASDFLCTFLAHPFLSTRQHVAHSNVCRTPSGISSRISQTRCRFSGLPPSSHLSVSVWPLSGAWERSLRSQLSLLMLDLGARLWRRMQPTAATAAATAAAATAAAAAAAAADAAAAAAAAAATKLIFASTSALASTATSTATSTVTSTAAAAAAN